MLSKRLMLHQDLNRGQEELILDSQQLCLNKTFKKRMLCKLLH